MIYKSSFFRKEFKQAYSEYRVSINWMFSFGVFLGLFSFSVHFLLQTLYESVLTDAIPEFMMPSYFSVTFAYTIISYVFFLIYFLYFYDYLTFSEIRDNSWYLLVKLGYNPMKMIFTKLAARLISVVITYSVGFLISILLTSFLKYPFVPDYFLPVYVSGLLDIIMNVLIAMTLSLFFRLFENARIVIIFSAVLIFALKIQTGYYKIVSNRGLMRDFQNMLDMKKSIYLILAGVLVVASVFICIFVARNIAKYYSVTEVRSDDLAVQDYRTNEFIRMKTKTDGKTSRIIVIFRNSVLLLVICTILLFNGTVLVLSAISPEKQVSFNGIIPYIFQSTTLQPEIMKNDLTFFRKIDLQQPLAVHDIIIFEENKEVFIEKIIEINSDTYTVDVTYYPPMSEVGALKKTIARENIYGLYSGGNRWLGALILFANTIFGRLIFLLLPAVLIFFYKPIVDFFRKLSPTIKKKKG